MSPSLFTVCESVYNTRSLPIQPEEALETAFRQLARFRDLDDGSVSGKSSGGEEDDCAMATLLAIQWSVYILADENKKRKAGI